MNQHRSLALFGLVLLMIMWGSTYAVTKATTREIPPATLAALRFSIASVVLLPIAWGGLRQLPRRITSGQLTLLAVSGISGCTIAFNYGLIYGSAAQGALIYAASPAAVAAAAFLFLKERLSRRRVAGIGLSILGVSTLIIAGHADVTAPNPIAGALWMLGAVICWTTYTVLSKRLAGSDSVSCIAVVSQIGTVLLIPLVVLELRHRPLPSPSISAWAGLLFLGSIASALAYLVYGYVLRRLDASLVGVYTTLDPIVGVLIAVLFYGETLHPGQLIGGLVAFAGMWLASSDGPVHHPD